MLDLLALNAELASGQIYVFVKAHTKKGTMVPDPLKIPRVWRETRETAPKRASTPEEIVGFFGDRLQVRYTPKTETTTTEG